MSYTTFQIQALFVKSINGLEPVVVFFFQSMLESPKCNGYQWRSVAKKKRSHNFEDLMSFTEQ
jgi:hypothetical protein